MRWLEAARRPRVRRAVRLQNRGLAGRSIDPGFAVHRADPGRAMRPVAPDFCMGVATPDLAAPADPGLSTEAAERGRTMIVTAIAAARRAVRLPVMPDRVAVRRNPWSLRWTR